MRFDFNWPSFRRKNWNHKEIFFEILIRYRWVYVFWYIVIGFIGGGFIALAEDYQVDGNNAILLSFAALSCTGFVPFEMSQTTRGTRTVVGFLMLLGSPVLQSLGPVLIRRYQIRKQVLKRDREKELEYQALKLVTNIVLTYYFTMLGLGFFFLATYAAGRPEANVIITNEGQTPGGWAIFHAISAFSNVGMSSFSNNMVSFETEPYPLLVLIFLTLMGNTFFPIFLRFLIYVYYIFTPNKKRRESLKYLLSHPRRCFTQLYLSSQTQWLMIIFLVLNILQITIFLSVSWGSSSISTLDNGDKFMNSLFSAVVTRSSGFYSVVVNTMPKALIALYLGMLFIPPIPVVPTVRPANLVLDRIPKEKEKEPERGEAEASTSASSSAESQAPSRKGTLIPKLPELTEINQSLKQSKQAFLEYRNEHRRSQMAAEGIKKRAEKDLVVFLADVPEYIEYTQADFAGGSPFYTALNKDSLKYQANLMLTDFTFLICVAMIIISIVEAEQLATNPNFPAFNIIFEVISGFGNVGLTMGYPGSFLCFSSYWQPISKYILIAVMLLGRLRDLPERIDPTVWTREDRIQAEREMHKNTIRMLETA